MKRYKVFWKNKPYIEVEREEDLENEKINIFTEISINIGDYLDFEEIEEIKPNTLKQQIREIIRTYDKNEGISYNDIYYNLSLCSCNKGIIYEEVKKNINDLLINGEIYESKPNVLRWLE